MRFMVARLGDYTEGMSWKELLKETVSEWLDDKAAQHSAALAFYTMFSLAPLLVLTVTVAGFAFGEAAARGELRSQMTYYVGEAGAETVQQILSDAESPAFGTIAGLISVVVLLLGASGAFMQLKTSIDVMFDIPPDPDETWMAMVVDRFFSFTMVLGTGFLLLVSLLLSTVLTVAVAWLGSLSGATAVVVMVLNVVVGFLFTTLLFGAIFRFVPSVRVPWADVWPGAILTSALFSLGRFMLGWYLGSGSVGSAYGAAGSLVVVLAWVYYSAQILFLGAEFTQVYGARRRGQAPGRSGQAIADTPDPDAEDGGPPPQRQHPAFDARGRAAATGGSVPVGGLAALLGVLAVLGVVGAKRMGADGP